MAGRGRWFGSYLRSAAWAAVVATLTRSVMRVRHLTDSGGQDMSAMPGMSNMTMLLREVTKKLRDSSRGKVIGGRRTVVR